MHKTVFELDNSFFRSANVICIQNKVCIKENKAIREISDRNENKNIIISKAVRNTPRQPVCNKSNILLTY